MMPFYILLTFCCLLSKHAFSQLVNSSRANTPWNAQWIAANDKVDKGATYGVYYFRKNFELKTKPAKFVVHLSADNQYKLFVNGQLASIGPARGDLYNWNYETVDIAQYLHSGKNNLSAVVWNEAAYRPEYQISLRTAFILQGHTQAEETANTNSTWKCLEDKAYQPVAGFIAAINSQYVDMNKTIRAWNSPSLDDSPWPVAANLFSGQPKGFSDFGLGYMLQPSILPARELIHLPIKVVRKATGIETPPLLRFPLTIPPNQKAVILLDQQEETNAYPTINFHSGKGAALSLGYAEALYEQGSNYKVKGNRNDVDGKVFYGLTDSIISNGGLSQTYTSFLFRTYRYMQVTVQTADAPLVIDSLYGTFTAYPFKAEAKFNSDNPEIKRILDIGWHTARLNAFDYYFTGQYYERLQYIGDARIQAMIAFYYSNDDRLTRNALNQFDQSRLSIGLTMSRYPTNPAQIIPTYSLLYIGMLHDYWMYRNDSTFVKSKLQGTRAILDFFTKYQQADGSLQHTPFWNFVDWTNSKNWRLGEPPLPA